MSVDKIMGVAKFVSRNSNVLCDVGAGEAVVELNSLCIVKIIIMYIEVSGDEELMLDGSRIGKERGKLV